MHNYISMSDIMFETQFNELCRRAGLNVKDEIYEKVSYIDRFQYKKIETYCEKKKKNQIKELAKDFRNKYWPSYKKAELNLKEIIKELNGDVIYYDINKKRFPDLICNEKDFIIFGTFSNKIFSLARALGHLIVHVHHNNILKNIEYVEFFNIPYDNYLSYEASWFAHELVLPTSFIEDAVKFFKNDKYKIVLHLSKECGIPVNLCEIRLNSYL